MKLILRAAAALAGGAIQLYAQQAIVNMPSADITPKGGLFLMHESQWRPWNPDRSWYGTNFLAYGVGWNTELAVTSYNTGTPAASNETIGFGFKTAVPLSGRNGGAREHKLTVGSMALASLTGKGMGNFSYVHYSFRLPKAKTRLTGGGWFGSEQLFLRKTGSVLAGVEHPLSKKVILLAEWFAGRHDLGFLIPGVLWHPTPKQFVVVAYKFPNQTANGKQGLVLEYGITLGGTGNGH
jgi:hypothetical protein